jgi:23S rRNA pseudouridine1911/1915/1917 synthase
MQRLALHAATLGFDHPVDERRLRFESPLPQGFLEVVAALERSQSRKGPAG